MPSGCSKRTVCEHPVGALFLLYHHQQKARNRQSHKAPHRGRYRRDSTGVRGLSGALFLQPPGNRMGIEGNKPKFIIPLLFWMVQKELFSHTLRCTNKLILFLTNLNDSFDSAILWTDHKKHPLMLWASFKESGIIVIIYALRDPGIATFAIINFFSYKSCYI